MTEPSNAAGTTDRFLAIADFVQDHLQLKALEHPSDRNNPVYRWEHSQRVAQHGKTLALDEGADVELVVAACLLHDVAHFESDDDYKDHGRRGAAIVRPLLEHLGYTPEQVDNICFSIAWHVDGEAGFDHPITVEAQCVTDADNIERFGAYRILQWCLPEMDEFPKLAEKLTARVEQLQEYRRREKILETASGDRLFKAQLDRQIAFFQALIAEHEATFVPIVTED